MIKRLGLCFIDLLVIVSIIANILDYLFFNIVLAAKDV